MRSSSRALAMGLAAGLLAGCASQQWYDGPPRPRSEVALLITNASQSLQIDVIDGKHTSTITERYELLPGPHSVVVRALVVDGVPTRNGKLAALTLHAEPGHTYRLRGFLDEAGQKWAPSLEDAGLPVELDGPALPVEELQRGCLGGKPRPCVRLGAIYEHGGTELGWNEKRAAVLYRQACATDDPAGCFHLADLHETGHGVARNETAAADLFEHVCEGGEPRACTRLGLLLQEGRGRPKDVDRASKRFESACNSGDAGGCYALGALARDGQGDGADYARATALFDKACGGGEPKGCAGLGLLYEYGLGVPRDERQAAALYDRACTAGAAMGCANLGTLYLLGLGVPKDESRAFQLFWRGCAKGAASACASFDALSAELQQRRVPSPGPPPEDKASSGACVEYAVAGSDRPVRDCSNQLEEMNRLPPLSLQTRGLRVGARGELDVLHLGFLPALSGEVLAESFSAVVALMIRFPPAFRLEGRYYPFQWTPVRPYLGFGTSLFFDGLTPKEIDLLPAVAARAVIGADLQILDGHVFADLALEHFFNPAPQYEPESLLLSVGAGRRF